MKRTLISLSTLAAFCLVAAAPADAQTAAGTVNVHGFVAPRCVATLNGDSTFSGTINLGELSQANGTLLATLANSTVNSPAGSAYFQIGCSGGAAAVELSATRLSNPNVPNLPTSSNDIDFTVQGKFTLGAGGFAALSYTTAATLLPPSTQLINSYFALVPENFQVSVYAFTAENGSSSILVPGNFDSVVTITVTPPA